MILFLFSIFNMKKLFSIVSPPTFHLAPRPLFITYLHPNAQKLKLGKDVPNRCLNINLSRSSYEANKALRMGNSPNRQLHSYLPILSLNNENSLKLPQSATNPLALFNFIYIKTYSVPRPKRRINSFTIHILHDRSKEAYLLT